MLRSVLVPMLLVSSLCAVPVEAAASEVTLTPRINHGVGELDLSLRVDGHDACRFVVRDEKNAAWPPPPLCSFRLEQGAQKIELQGSQKRLLLPRALKQSWRVRDLAPVTRSLYEPGLAFSTRVPQLVERAQSLAGWDQLQSAPQPADPAQLDAIEERLGAPLPRVLRDFYSAFGPFTFGSLQHRFASVSELGPIAPILRQFGDDAALADPELQAHFERAVFVAMEGGDGIGYIGYQPAPNALGVERAWFRFHQDGQTFQWLRDGNGRALDDNAALVRVLEVLLVEQVYHTDELDLDELRVDTARSAFTLELRFDPSAKSLPFDLSLSVVW